MVKPNLFIVGAAKSGTSSLWQYLRSNPEVYMPEDDLYKEPCFFSAYGEGIGLTNYLKIFERAGNGRKFVGEASTAYLSDPVSARRLFEFNPDAKIVIMLRNPADRAYSLYNWMVQDGYEFAETFKEALRLEDGRRAKNIPNWYEPQYYWNYMYFRSGCYAEQVERYLKLFGDKVLLIKFEDFKDSTAAEYAKVCDFLGIEHNDFEHSVFNPSRRVISARMQFILRKLTFGLSAASPSDTSAGADGLVLKIYSECLERLGSVSRFTLKDRIRGHLLMRRVKRALAQEAVDGAIETKEQRDKLMKLGLLGGKPPKMDHNVRRRLLDRYRDDIQKLSQLTGRDFGEWAA